MQRYVTVVKAMSNSQFPDQPPLSNAERQARYCARLKMQQQAPAIRYRRPADRRSRLQRWLDAVAELLSLQTYYTAWFDALPEGLQDTPTAMALQAIIDLEELATIVPPAATDEIDGRHRRRRKSTDRGRSRLTNTKEG
jgi:hypothetical protein